MLIRNLVVMVLFIFLFIGNGNSVLAQDDTKETAEKLMVWQLDALKDKDLNRFVKHANNAFKSILIRIQQELKMNRKIISSGSEFESKIGYSRAIVDGDFVFVSGTTGYDYEQMTLSDDLLEQAHQCFKNIEKALNEAGSHFDQVVRVRYIFPNKLDFEPCWPIFNKFLGKARPAATMFVADLLDEKIKLEIEVTAKVIGR